MAHCYIRVSKDEYRLIEAIADTVGELAKMCGTTKNSILSQIAHKRGYWEKVEFEEDE